MAETKSLLKTRTTKSGTVGSNPTHSAKFFLSFTRPQLIEDFMTAKIFSVFTGIFLISFMSQASVVGFWTGKLASTNSLNLPSTYNVEQTLKLENNIFTIRQRANNLTWFDEEFSVVDGVLLKNNTPVGIISDTGFTINHVDLTKGDFYDASFSLNTDGTANYQDKVSYKNGDWESVSGALILTPAPVL